MILKGKQLVDKEISSMELSKFRKSINVDWDIKVWVSEGPDTCVAEMIGIDDEGFHWEGLGVFDAVSTWGSRIKGESVFELSFVLDSTCPGDWPEESIDRKIMESELEKELED